MLRYLDKKDIRKDEKDIFIEES